MNAILTRLARVSILSTLWACWPAPELGPPVEIVTVEPDHGVGVHDAVRLTFSDSIEIVEHPTATAEGRNVDVGFELGGDDRTVRLWPKPAWPSGARVSVDLSGLVDPFGRSVEEPIEFFTVTRTASISVYSRSPALGSTAPLNLRQMAVSISPPTTRAMSAVLRSQIHTVPLALDAQDSRGTILLSLPEQAAACRPLCPEQRYELELTLADGTLIASELASVRTSTIVDTVAPTIGDVDVDLAGSSLLLRGHASEGVLVRATLTSTNARRVAMGEPFLAEDFEISFDELQANVGYDVTLEGEDMCGNPLSPKVIRVSSPPEVAVFISEVVPTPLHDWNDSVTAGAPFDSAPGGGAVTDTDEWIELVNASSDAIDLDAVGLTVRTLDATPSETRMAHAQALAFGSGGSTSRWLPGEALVARLRGSMSQRGLIIEVYAGRTLLDRVEISDAVTSSHPGGRPPDFLHESIARDARGGWAWCAPTPGDPLAASDCL
ncbi:MAG: hypothetical protein HY791_18375 [Deltaproteobacteria bacterium]|nr:hypothetical protein [Deltaproteobacteria bacterium]